MKVFIVGNEHVTIITDFIEVMLGVQRAGARTSEYFLHDHHHHRAVLGS